MPSGKYSLKRGFFPGPLSKSEIYSDTYETEWHFLAEAYPETEFVVCPAETQNINRYNWFTTPEGIEKVMGELSRCGGQFLEAIPVWKDFK